MEGDDLEMVAARIHAAEHMLLPWVVSDLSIETFLFQNNAKSELQTDC